MAIDTTAPRSRRALLAGALAGLAGAIGASAARVAPAAAANGEPVLIGQLNGGSNETGVSVSTEGTNALTGYSDSGAGVAGLSDSNVGLYGLSQTSIGVWGDSGSGTGVHGVSPGVGTSGLSQGGIGVLARGLNGGVGLRVQEGRVRIDQASGVATIPSGVRGTTVSPGIGINERTFVLLTPMANIGSRSLWFTKNPSADTFTIRMSTGRGRSTRIAWLALERG